ncbi:carbon-nitrogen hydrolase family protein [Nocardioides donggukensis]|uniref:Carbon-nitrogen hydrolase family protein n=1 Tax=Nocardioides donggukensis TaxID=2774019 RepID=A0A927Q0L0_9ACTN|nr:carbon-nitrogen hydrolase family protein [Nocardioides donggukensis]MBD8868559.1 carbon-nitrogen hydrolase family protein [Nocardioides donggukensis]
MTSPGVLRVAAAQAVSVSGDLVANVATAARMAGRATDRGARVVLLPEAFLTGYDRAAFGGPLPAADDLEGAWLDPLREVALTRRAWLLVGTPLARGPVRTLSLLLVTPDGTVTAPYDKQHLSGPDETDFFDRGDHGATLSVDGVVLGLSICYDGSFPEHARAAADAGAHAYLNPAAFFRGAEHRRDLYTAARALDNGMYAVLAGLTGRCGSGDFSGGSAVHDPEGRPLGRLGDEEGVVVADIDPAVVEATRAAHPMLADRTADLGRVLRC